MRKCVSKCLHHKTKDCEHVSGIFSPFLVLSVNVDFGTLSQDWLLCVLKVDQSPGFFWRGRVSGRCELCLHTVEIVREV